jgi:hypothetical protein
MLTFSVYKEKEPEKCNYPNPVCLIRNLNRPLCVPRKENKAFPTGTVMAFLILKLEGTKVNIGVLIIKQG